MMNLVLHLQILDIKIKLKLIIISNKLSDLLRFILHRYLDDISYVTYVSDRWLYFT